MKNRHNQMKYSQLLEQKKIYFEMNTIYFVYNFSLLQNEIEI